MQAMADATGHRLRIRPHVNTFDLVEIAEQKARAEGMAAAQTTEPASGSRSCAHKRSGDAVSVEELDEVCERYNDMTGFRLDVTV